MEISPEQIEINLKSSGAEERTAETIGNTLAGYEAKLVEKYSKQAQLENPDPQLEGEIKKLELLYQRAVRTMEAFMTMMKNAHEIMMRAIQNLSVR